MRVLLALAVSVRCAVASEAVAQLSVSSVEDIHIARSLRLSRVAATEYCAEARVGFGNATFEDRYTFHAIAVGPTDGKLTNADAGALGQLRACYGATSNSLVSRFYAQGDLAGVSFTGRGECRANKADYPEPGITPYVCFLELSDLPQGYAGGQLTTNTVVSRQLIGRTSDPSGYVQPSIATVRLWKRR